MSNIYKKLADVQAELKAPKSQYNSFSKYYYRNAEDIIEAAKPLCIAHGLVLTLDDDIITVGSRTYVKATAAVHSTDDDGGVIEVSAKAREAETKKGMDESQITGASSSYARKYALGGLFALDDTRDADTQPPTNPPELHCSECKKIIQGDSKLTARQIADKSKEKFGRVLCVECAKKVMSSDGKT